MIAVRRRIRKGKLGLIMHDVMDSRQIHAEFTTGRLAGPVNASTPGAGGRLLLNLYGPMFLRGPDGAELTPRARKAQGLLALLGTSPGLKRSRSWLQDKLWSDRGPEQGAASLRQCLSEIRRRLGPHVDCLRTGGGWVELDAGRVEVNSDPPAGPEPGDGCEFLEGLDIRDPEFEHWLRDQRLARADAVAQPSPASAADPFGDGPALPAPRPLVLVDPAEATSDMLRAVADMITEDAALQVARNANGSVVRQMVESDGRGRAIGLRVFARATELGGTLYLQLRLSDLADGSVIWMEMRELPDGRLPSRSDGPVALLINEAVAVAVEELARMGDRATDADRLALLGYQATRHTILLDLDRQSTQDRMLREAFEIDPRGIYLARRALLWHNRAIERTGDCVEDVRAAAIEMARRGLEMDPTNATVVAAAAKTSLNLEGRVEGGTHLARRAVELGPTNPLAWESRATAYAHAGQADKAHAAALRARSLATHLPESYLWEMVCCMTACVAGQLDEAILFGTRANDLAPTFKPPLRYLAALHFARGDREAARARLKALKAVEPDFTLEAMAGEDYPLAALRRTPLIAVTQSGLI